MSTSERPTDVELLEIRTEGSTDARGRIIGLRGVLFACTRAAEAVWIGSAVPDDLAKALEATRECAPASTDPTDPPPTLKACERLLAAEGWSVRYDASLVYLVESDAHSTPDAEIERSDGSIPEWMRKSNPGNWHPIEWDELLDGCLGPWAMATDGQRIVSICHTPLPMTGRAAECGVWTDPDFRGRGYAAVVTAEWAALLRPSGRSLFYSTTAENHSSQRVAERLKARMLGWNWQLSEVGEPVEDHIHPLSELRHKVAETARDRESNR